MKFYFNTVIQYVELLTITPAMAVKILENAAPNRKLKRVTVERYSRDLSNGAWALTHQGIAFDADGRLIDGQHRIQAVIDSGVSMTTLAFGYAMQTKAMLQPLDVGNKRKTTDITGINPTIVGVLNYILNKILNMRGTSDSEVLAIYNTLQEHVDALDPLLGSTRRIIGSAPALSAVLVAHIMGVDYVAQYRQILSDSHDVIDPVLYRLRSRLDAIPSLKDDERKYVFCTTLLSILDPSIKRITTPAMQRTWEQAQDAIRARLGGGQA